MVGDHRFDDRLTDYSEEARARYVEALKKLDRQIRGVSPEGLSERDQTTLDMLRIKVRDRLDGEALAMHLW